MDLGSNVPVLIVFFNRSEPLREVFEAVRKAKPVKLFLAQDGARKGNSKDAEKVAACREVVQNIDWECEVFTDYSESNLGCGKRMSSAISWAFEQVDRLMILEDDCVPAADFFPFCEEILEKYKEDERVNLISGMNHLGVYEKAPADYFFCSTGAIWGWATWKRVWDHYEYEMDFLEDSYAMECFSGSYYPKRQLRMLNQTGKSRSGLYKQGGKLTAWTYQFRMLRFLFSQLVIVPKYNLTSNIGLTDDSTHGGSELRKTPKGLQCVFYAKTYAMQFPLQHPKYMISDTRYDKEVQKIMGWTFWRGKVYRLESISRQILFAKKGDYRNLWRKLLKKLGIKK